MKNIIESSHLAELVDLQRCYTQVLREQQSVARPGKDGPVDAELEAYEDRIAEVTAHLDSVLRG